MPKTTAQPKKKKTEKKVSLKDNELKKFMNALEEAFSDEGGTDAISQAQELVYEAWDTPQKRGRIALANAALKISADCADAYVLLGMEAKTPKDAIAYFRQGVEAGERALGRKAFKEDVGYFWGILETRPYMRARHTLAVALWDTGKREEAITHYQDMLRLNPHDNQGIRYILLTALLFLGKDKEAAALHKKYKDDCMADWAWSKALLLFRTKGDAEESRKALAVAVGTNEYVADLLLGRKKLPKDLPPYISPGDKDEAVSYVCNAVEAWRAAPGALEWVEKTLAEVN